MNAETYAQTQTTILLMADIVADLPLIAFLSDLQDGEHPDLELDPSIYGASQERLIELAAALFPFEAAARKFREGQGHA